jgi:hypothetical protein
VWSIKGGRKVSEAKKYTKKQVLAIVSIVFEEILEELDGMKEKMIQQVEEGMDEEKEE